MYSIYIKFPRNETDTTLSNAIQHTYQWLQFNAQKHNEILYTHTSVRYAALPTQHFLPVLTFHLSKNILYTNELKKNYQEQKDKYSLFKLDLLFCLFCCVLEEGGGGRSWLWAATTCSSFWWTTQLQIKKNLGVYF